MSESYSTPTVEELGQVEDLTFDVHKVSGTGDVVYVNGVPIADGPYVNS